MKRTMALITALEWAANDVGTAAAAGPGSMCWIGELDPSDAAAAIEVSISVRHHARFLSVYWYNLGRGILGPLRAWLSRSVVEQLLVEMHARLDGARVGWHPRFGESYCLRSRDGVQRRLSA